jgi:hypothetical protein
MAWVQQFMCHVAVFLGAVSVDRHLGPSVVNRDGAVVSGIDSIMGAMP